MEESLFSRADNNQSNQALSEYLSSLGTIDNPDKYRKETNDRNDFNNKLLAGTGTVAGPLALTGIEGLRQDAIRPGLRMLAKSVGVSNETADALAEGRVDVRAAARGVVKKGLTAVGNKMSVAGEKLQQGLTSVQDGMSGVGEQLERRALIQGNPKWPTEVNIKGEGDALHRNFLGPDDERFGRFDPEGRTQAFRSGEPVLTADDRERAIADGRDTFEKVKAKYLSRAAARGTPQQSQARNLLDENREMKDESIFKGISPEDEGISSTKKGRWRIWHADDDEDFEDPMNNGIASSLPESAPQPSAAGTGEQLDMQRALGEIGNNNGLGNSDSRVPSGATQDGATQDGATQDADAGNVRVTPKSGADGGGDDEAENIGKNLGKSAAEFAETDAELGGPEDVVGDVLSLALGLGTLFGGQSFEKKAPAPVLRTPLNPSSEFGL